MPSGALHEHVTRARRLAATSSAQSTSASTEERNTAIDICAGKRWLASAASVAALGGTPVHADEAHGHPAQATYYTTKTPYRPQQDASSYERAPSRFDPVFTELVARRGSPGLSGVKNDAAACNMWKKASQDAALTALGEALGDDISAIMKANALLGFGVAGYGHKS